MSQTEIKSNAAKRLIEFLYPKYKIKYSGTMVGIDQITSNSSTATPVGTCPSCGGRIDNCIFSGKYHCWDCSDSFDPIQVGINNGSTKLLTDDEIDNLLINNPIMPSIKLSCPDCGSSFIKEGIRLFTSVEPNRCGDCGHKWGPK